MKNKRLRGVDLREGSALIAGLPSLSSHDFRQKNNIEYEGTALAQHIGIGRRAGGAGKAVKRAISIQALIEWAFRREFASIDFVQRDTACGYGYASSTAAILRHEQLGCRIDGGGSSPCHPDADQVAHALAALPEARGGRAMALRIAELARAGLTPDWMPGATPRCVPREIKHNQHGMHSATEVIGCIDVVSRGRKRRFDVRVCPVTYSPTAAQIAAARRAYLDWWGALLDLRDSFRVYGGLSSYSVTEAMPPMAPWKKNVDCEKQPL